MCRQPSSSSPARTRLLVGSPRAFLPAANRGDAQRGEQVAERVGHHGDDRPEQADRRPAQRRPDRDGAPVRRLEPRVRHEQVIRPDEGLEVGAAGRVEGDLGRGDHGRDDQQLDETEPAEGVGDRDRHHDREPGQVHRDHHRPLAAKLHPRRERHRDQRAHGRPDRGQRGHLSGAGMQHQHGDQRERPEPQPGAVGADRVGRPQPAELPAQGSSRHQARNLRRKQPAVDRSDQSKAGERGSNNRNWRRATTPCCASRVRCVDLDAVRTFVAAADAGQFQEAAADAVDHPAGRLQAHRRAGERPGCAPVHPHRARRPAHHRRPGVPAARP